MQVRLNRFSQLFVIFLGVIFAVSCDSDLPTADSKSESLVKPAKLIKIGESSSNNFLNFPAVIESQQLSSLSFEVGGVLKELLVVEAQEVKQGEVLAKLDQRDLQAKLSSARAEFDNAEAEYRRAELLMKQDAIAKSTLDERKARRDVAKAQLETQEKALQDSVLIAPYSGNISRISIKEKQAVTAGKVAISILGDGGLEAKMNLPSSIIALARDEKSSKSEAYLVLDVAPELKIPAQFKEASLEADANSQTYELTFNFDRPEGLNILPGMNATLWFKDPHKSGKSASEIRVPLTAITTDGDQKYVWVVSDESMAVSRRNVTISEEVGANLTVLTGLEVGETIVAAGVSYLSEGIIVRPWTQ